MALPADLDHWIGRHSKYLEDFVNCKGVLIAVVNLKLGPVRGAFLHAWRKAVASTGPGAEALEKAFAAAAATVVASGILSSNGARDPFNLRQWMKQCNSTTAFHHGSGAYLRRWGVLQGGTRGQPGPLQVATMSEAGRAAMCRMLGSDAHSLVESIVPTSTLQEWVAQVERLAPEVERLQLPGLCRGRPDRDSYGIGWTLRCLLLGTNYARQPASGPVTLRYEAPDSISLLRRGFPDVSAEVTSFASMLGVTRVGSLVAGLQYRSGIEFLCMDLCLAKPVYVWLARHQLTEEFVRQAAPRMMPKAEEFFRTHRVLPSLVTVLEKLRVEGACSTRPIPEPSARVGAAPAPGEPASGAASRKRSRHASGASGSVLASASGAALAPASGKEEVAASVSGSETEGMSSSYALRRTLRRVC